MQGGLIRQLTINRSWSIPLTSASCQLAFTFAADAVCERG